jgi:cysteine-rich repeat protein
MPDTETVDSLWMSEEIFAQVVSASDTDTMSPRRTDTGGEICGDGIIFGDEECDDGNNESGDGCSSSCALELCPDADGDSVCDEEDNCPHAMNESQLDTNEDGIGDACQCGDVNGDGVVNTTDALLIVRGKVTHADDLARCDVSGDEHCACNTTDALMIVRGWAAATPQHQTCPASTGQ